MMVLFGLVGMVFSLFVPVAVALGVIGGLARWQPAQPATWERVIGPPLAVMSLNAGLHLVPLVAYLAITGFHGLGVGNTREVLTMGLIGVTAVLVTGAFNGALAYVFGGGLWFIASRTMRDRAPWLGRSVALAAGSVLTLTATALFVYFGPVGTIIGRYMGQGTTVQDPDNFEPAP